MKWFVDANTLFAASHDEVSSSLTIVSTSTEYPSLIVASYILLASTKKLRENILTLMTVRNALIVRVRSSFVKQKPTGITYYIVI